MSIANYYLGVFIYKGAKSIEDKTDIQKHALAYNVVMRLLKMGNSLSKGYHIFMDNYFISIPLAKRLYKLGTYLNGTIRRNKTFTPQAFNKKIGGRGAKKNFEVDQCLSRE